MKQKTNRLVSDMLRHCQILRSNVSPRYQEKQEMRKKRIASAKITSVWNGFEEKLKVESLVQEAEESIFSWGAEDPPSPISELSLQELL